MRSDYIWNT